MSQDAEDIVECLRSGLPPDEDLAALVVGHGPFIDRVSHILDRIAKRKTPAACRFIVGPPGAGKTTLLRLIRDEARQRNFAVSEVAADAMSGVVREPKYLVPEVFRRLAANTRVTSHDWDGVLKDFSDRVIREVKQEGLPESPSDQVKALRTKVEAILGPHHIEEPSVKTATITYAVSRFKGDDECLERMRLVDKWFSGEHLDSTDLGKIFVDAKIDDRTALPVLRSAIPVLVEAGHPGLVLLIDEMQRSMNQFRDAQTERSYALAQAFVDRAVPQTFVAFAGTEALFGGNLRGIPQSSPSLIRRLSHPSGSEGEGPDPYALKYEVPKLNREDMEALFPRILECHKKGERWSGGGLPSTASEFVDMIAANGDMLAGEFVKRTVEALDRRRQSGARATGQKNRRRS